ncbi:hypothetical protein [Halomonas sp. 25-S5]|uniref:hypothetical protein n=1 Tax=Halomonas sp. 25-S5 TaxID=2994065 RepID=UPI00246848F9|nr:hypothetical protein [Halomonas sp. 25-S5]
MNRQEANAIVFGFEAASTRLEHTEALFEAIASLLDTHRPADHMTVLKLAQLGKEVASDGMSEAYEAGLHAEQALSQATPVAATLTEESA